jgi:uncharacterized protein involved in outer membrane biogenesis
MKKALLIIGVLVIVLVGAAAIFLATFDADRYRPLIIQRAEDALGKPVRLERVRLGWRGGIALQLDGVAIYPDQAAAQEPVVRAESVSAVVRLWPLLRKDVQVASVTLIKPMVHVARQASGAVGIAGLEFPGGGAPSSAAPAAVGLLISSLAIEDGTLRFTDASQQPALDVTVTHADVQVRNISLTRPIEFRATLALCSEAQNLETSGRLQLPMAARAGRLEALRFATDLGALQIDCVVRAIPTAASPAGRVG